MKAIKTIGLVALTALTAVAFVGTTSAMAESTTLCKADESSCAEANLIKSVHETSVGKAKLLSSVGTTECDVLSSGSMEGAGNPLVITSEFTYTNCKLGASACTFTEENGPGEFKVLKEGHETAKVTGEYLVHLQCETFIDCSYNGTGLVGTAKGPLLSAQEPDNGEVSLSEQSLTKEAGGFLCPKTAKLDITTSPLTAKYFSNEVSSGGSWVSAQNVGGEATEGPGGNCIFTAVNQKCRIKFANTTMRTLAVISHEFKGTNVGARYALIAEGCTFNLGLGECIDEIEVTLFEAGVNDYCLIYKDSGTGEKQIRCAILKM